MILARRLAAHPKVRSVRSVDRCALVTIDVGTLDAASRAIAALELISLSPSLGGVMTTASHPATSSHRALSLEERTAIGIGDGLLRLSIGVEAVDDLWADCERALNSL